MNAYILTGDAPAKDEFVNDFVGRNRILPYNISVFSEPLKIAEARNIKKSISISGSGVRLFIMKTSPLPEAQNALLKTLEEPPDDVHFVFFDDQELLPTIVSRCQVVRLDAGAVLDTREYEEVIYESLATVHMGMGSVIILVDKLALLGLDLDSLSLALRNVMIRLVLEKNFEKAHTTGRFLESLQEKYSLLVHNNLNRSLALAAMFHEARSDQLRIAT